MFPGNAVWGVGDPGGAWIGGREVLGGFFRCAGRGPGGADGFRDMPEGTPGCEEGPSRGFPEGALSVYARCFSVIDTIAPSSTPLRSAYGVTVVISPSVKFRRTFTGEPSIQILNPLITATEWVAVLFAPTYMPIYI